MGTYKCRQEGFLKAWQINVAELMFRGKNQEQIISEVFPEAVTEGQRAGKRKQLRRLRENEKFQAYYKSLVTEWSVHNVGKALSKLSEQIDSDKPWIANKAANDVLIHSKQFMNDGDDKAVVVKFEGGVNLGTPDTE